MPVIKALLGKKVGMTRIFMEGGVAVAATVIEAGPCVVVDKRNVERDGYPAVQLGFGAVTDKHVTKPVRGQFTRVGLTPQRVLREFRLTDNETVAAGQELKADVFAAGDRVDVRGISKGKGFAGAMKRHNFHGAGATHGSMSHRRPASAGATGPARVWPGSRRPGHMGDERVTVKSLRVLQVDPERNLLVLEGAVPGGRGGLLEITVPSVPMGRARRDAKRKTA